MSVLRVIVFNMDEPSGPSLRSTLNSFDSVRIVAEVDEPAMLAHVVQQFSAEVLVVHLDPNPDSVVSIAAEVATANPNLACFAVSESTDGKLILSVMRRGFREFITKPIDKALFGEALSKIKLQLETDGPRGRLIALLGTAGGAGTTTLATNLAVELASLASGRVTIVDLDYRFGHVATLLDVSPSYTIADLAQTPEQLEPQLIERTLVKHESGVYVLSRPTHFVQCENITAANCVGVLSGLAGMSEYVIVDGPNRYDVGAAAILDVADLTLLVIQLLVPSVRNAQRILQGMQEAGFNLDRTRLVCNRMGKESGPLHASDVEATLGKPIFASIPDDWATVSSAVNLGEPLSLRGPKTRVRAAIRELAERIHGNVASTDEKDGAKKGARILNKIFNDG